MCAGDSGPAGAVTSVPSLGTAGPVAHPIHLEPVDAVHITTLVDNVSDMLLVSEGPARRVGLASPPENAPTMPAAFSVGPVRAGHTVCRGVSSALTPQAAGSP